MSLIHQAAALVALMQAWILLHKRAVMRAAFPQVSYGPRMKRAPFYELVKRFRERGLLSDSIHTYVEEQVAMFLHVVGHNHRFRVMQNTFRRSIDTISCYFDQVLYAIGEIR
jgi:hypothetical protein